MKVFTGKAATCLGISTTALMAQAQQAASQAPTPAFGATTHDGVADIGVTAQNPSESVQKISLAITAVSGASLQRLGISSTNALQTLARA